MEFETEDQQIIDLLTRLKNQGGVYPRKLLVPRRQVFLSQMASVGLGLGIGAGIKMAAKSSKGGTLFHFPALSASSLVETLLVLAIVVQASAIAYRYRDKITDFVNTLSSSYIPTEVSIPVTGSSPTDIVVSDTPTVMTTETPSASPSSTVTTLPSTSESDNGNDTSNNNSSASSTAPAATPRPTNDNNGNHYGQTPRPPQEKSDPKPTRNTGGGNGNGNDKKP